MRKRCARVDPTHSELLGILSYEPDTGLFHWLVSKPGVKPGRLAGSLGYRGYWQISINGKVHLAHRLAWFYIHGVWPTSQIDHKNMKRDDNRIENLRPATPSQNRANTRPGTSMSGLKGAHWNKARQYWQSYVKLNGRSIYLGSFDSAEAAHKAHAAAILSIHGEFARIA